MAGFAYTILYVQDVVRSVEFYERAFGLERKFIAEGDIYAELLTGSTTLSLASINLAKSNLPGGFTEADRSQKPFAIEIGFTTDNVEETYQLAVAAGAMPVEPAKTKPWGQVVAYVRDLDGFLVEICSAI